MSEPVRKSYRNSYELFLDCTLHVLVVGIYFVSMTYIAGPKAVWQFIKEVRS